MEEGCIAIKMSGFRLLSDEAVLKYARMRPLWELLS